MKKRLILTGFMGAGKSYTAEKLANATGINYLDTDDIIVKKTGLSIQQIFEYWGEAYFRKLEVEVFSDLPLGIIAAGGGCILTESVRNVLKDEENLVVWLNTDWSVILDRIMCSDRPLVKKSSEEQLHCLYEKRIPLYKECADLIINNSAKNLSQFITIIKQHFSDI